MSIYAPQSADLNGLPSRIALDVQYRFGGMSSTLPIGEIIGDEDSLISPPLSKVEIADIEESEREFSSGKIPVFDDSESLINDLHTARSKLRREGRE